jgi:hypothetical protein
MKPNMAAHPILYYTETCVSLFFYEFRCVYRFLYMHSWTLISQPLYGVALWAIKPRYREAICLWRCQYFPPWWRYSAPLYTVRKNRGKLVLWGHTLHLRDWCVRGDKLQQNLRGVSCWFAFSHTVCSQHSRERNTSTSIYKKRKCWKFGWLVGDHLLLRDFGPYGIIFIFYVLLQPIPVAARSKA